MIEMREIVFLECESENKPDSNFCPSKQSLLKVLFELLVNSNFDSLCGYLGEVVLLLCDFSQQVNNLKYSVLPCAHNHVKSITIMVKFYFHYLI